MTYKELLDMLRAFPPEVLEGRVDVWDNRTNNFYPIKAIYNQKNANFDDKEGYYTFLTFESKKHEKP